jgi:hypothetical protein
MLCGKATVVTKKRSFLEQNANSEEELAIIGFQLVFSSLTIKTPSCPRLCMQTWFKSTQALSLANTTTDLIYQCFKPTTSYIHNHSMKSQNLLQITKILVNS